MGVLVHSTYSAETWITQAPKFIEKQRNNYMDLFQSCDYRFGDHRRCNLQDRRTEVRREEVAVPPPSSRSPTHEVPRMSRILAVAVSSPLSTLTFTCA